MTHCMKIFWLPQYFPYAERNPKNHVLFQWTVHKPMVSAMMAKFSTKMPICHAIYAFGTRQVSYVRLSDLSLGGQIHTQNLYSQRNGDLLDGKHSRGSYVWLEGWIWIFWPLKTWFAWKQPIIIGNKSSRQCLMTFWYAVDVCWSWCELVSPSSVWPPSQMLFIRHSSIMVQSTALTSCGMPYPQVLSPVMCNFHCKCLWDKNACFPECMLYHGFKPMSKQRRPLVSWSEPEMC